jgi:hypothetical protein
MISFLTGRRRTFIAELPKFMRDVRSSRAKVTLVEGIRMDKARMMVGFALLPTSVPS